MPYQLQKKAEALEYLKGDVDRIRVAREELRAQVQVRALVEMRASTTVLAFEVQLSLNHDSAKIQAGMNRKLESDLLKGRTEKIDAWAEAALSRTKSDHEMAICMKDVANAQDELK